MLKKKLSNDFWLFEFENNGFPKNPSNIEAYLLLCLVNSLQVLRNNIQKVITVTDCYRDDKRYLELIKAGYNPSPTSDHFWNQPIELLERQHPKQFKKYGSSYNTSVGATDIVCEGVKEVFDHMCSERVIYSKLFGQIIYEKQGVKEWLHLSNNPSVLYSGEAISELGLERDKWLMSVDGGKNYRRV